MLRLHNKKLIDTDGDFKLYTRSQYAEFIRGNLYDPEDHIYRSGTPLTELMQNIDMDADFAWYVNRPIYKRVIVPPDHYLYNKRTGTDLYVAKDEAEQSFVYVQWLFDEEMNKLDKPQLDIDDGFLVVVPNPRGK